MATEFDPTEQWDRVASELRAYKQTQQQAWGDIDNATLGRYLAGDLSGEERAQVEQALTQLPEFPPRKRPLHPALTVPVAKTTKTSDSAEAAHPASVLPR